MKKDFKTITKTSTIGHKKKKGTKPRARRRKKITNIRRKFNQIKNRKTMERIN